MWPWKSAAVAILQDPEKIVTNKNEKRGIWNKIFRVKGNSQSGYLHQACPPGIPRKARLPIQKSSYIPDAQKELLRPRHSPLVPSVSKRVSSLSSRPRSSQGKLVMSENDSCGPMFSQRPPNRRRCSESDTLLRASFTRSLYLPQKRNATSVTQSYTEVASCIDPKFPTRRRRTDLIETSTSLRDLTDCFDKPSRATSSPLGTGTSLYPIEESPAAIKQTGYAAMRRFSTTDIGIKPLSNFVNANFALPKTKHRHSIHCGRPMRIQVYPTTDKPFGFNMDPPLSPASCSSGLTDREMAILQVAGHFPRIDPLTHRRISHSSEISTENQLTFQSLHGGGQTANEASSLQPMRRHLSLFGSEQQDRKIISGLLSNIVLSTEPHLTSSKNQNSGVIDNGDRSLHNACIAPAATTMKKLFGGVITRNGENSDRNTSNEFQRLAFARSGYGSMDTTTTSSLHQSSLSSASSQNLKGSFESVEARTDTKNPHFFSSHSIYSSSSEKKKLLSEKSFHFDEFVQDTILLSATTSLGGKALQRLCQTSKGGSGSASHGSAIGCRPASMSPYEKGRPQSVFGGSSNNLKRFLETRMQDIFSVDKFKDAGPGRVIEDSEEPIAENWFDAERRTCRYLCHRFETLVDLIMHPSESPSKRTRNRGASPSISHIAPKQWAAIAEGTHLLVQFNLDNLIIPSTEVGKFNGETGVEALNTSEVLLVRAVTRSLRRINLTLLYPQWHQQPLFVSRNRKGGAVPNAKIRSSSARPRNDRSRSNNL